MNFKFIQINTDKAAGFYTAQGQVFLLRRMRRSRKKIEKALAQLTQTEAQRKEKIREEITEHINQQHAN